MAVTRPQYRSGLVRPGGGNVLTGGLAADDTGDVGEFEDLAARWRSERAERQLRRHLDPADFEALGDLGLWRSAAPHDRGGSWRGAAESIRPLCDSVRTVAAGDPSPALVAAMHPAVLAFWLTHDADHRGDSWSEQFDAVVASAAAGEQWGTVTSEPGSGGDLARTRAVATPIDGGEVGLPGRVYAISGDKHFASGFGVADWMITTAVPAGESAPTFFAIDLRGAAGPHDGLRVIAEWDGMGMAATQSHALRLEDVPAVRFASDEPLDAISAVAAPVVVSLFASVILGVFDEAIATSRQRLAPQAESLRAFEQVEWTRAEHEHWLAEQAWEGGLRAVEAGGGAAARADALRAKQAVAELAESSLRRLCRVHGGGSFSARSPFAHWFEDVRALGFLRPPWALADDALFATSFGT